MFRGERGERVLVAQSWARVVPPAASTSWVTKQIRGFYSSSIERDQHQPASSYWGRWCQAASTISRRMWVLPDLVIDPSTRADPEECLQGISSTKEPMLLPVNGASRRSRPPVRSWSGCTQASQPPHQWNELRAGGHLLDRSVEAVTAGLGDLTVS